MIDTHCHLYADAFDLYREEVEKAAKEIGIEHILLPNIDIDSIEALMSLRNSDSNFYRAMMGLHPCSVKSNDFKEQLSTIKKQLFRNPTGYCAVGEIGLDLYWDKSSLDIQQQAFKEQIEWAKELNLPIAVHVREAFEPLFEILDDFHDTKLKGVFHCFSGTLEQAHKALAYSGFYLGIGGVLTFKNAGLDKFIPQLPLDRIILETDSPYVAPSPFRGKRNEPSYLKYVLNKMAELFEMEEDYLRKKTSENARILFSL